MLAGPKVSKLLPFLQSRGFVGDAWTGGAQALQNIRQSPCHVLIFELELGDMMGVDLARTGKTERIIGATLLLEDPMKSGMIVSALAKGIDAFVATPPDEAVFLDKLEGLLLAQWGLAVTAQQQALTAEVQRLQVALAGAEDRARTATTSLETHKKQLERELTDERKKAERDLADERKKVRDLIGEIASLRDQLTTMHLVTGAKTGVSDEGNAAHSDEHPRSDDLDATGEFDMSRIQAEADDGDNEFENERTQAMPGDMAAAFLRSERPDLNAGSAGGFSNDLADFENEATPAAGTAPNIPGAQSFGANNEDTAPGGHQLPSQLSPAKQKPKARTAVDLNADMLKDLSRLHTADEDEVIFVDDD